MGRKATGSVMRDGDRFYALIAIDKGKRRAFALPTCADEGAAEARKNLLAGWAARLRAAGKTEAVLTVIESAAKSPDDKLAVHDELVDRMAGAPSVFVADAAGAYRTFADVADAWTSGKLAKAYPDFVKLKKTSDDDASRLKLINKHVGDTALRAFNLEHYKRLLAALPESFAPATRRHHAQIVHRVLALAVWPLEVIRQHPIPRGAMPSGKSTKAKAYLYPSEDRKLLACTDVPLSLRVLYGFLAREGCRTGEAAALTWAMVDLERGALTLDKNKTDEPRAWALDPGVARALAAWKELAPATKPGDFVFTHNDRPIDGSRLAVRLRADLATAKVDRPELTASTDERLQMRAHDLRATFITLALAAGRSEAWISDRTGHTTSAMISLYKRAARSATELNLGSLDPLDEAVPEFNRQEKAPISSGNRAANHRKRQQRQSLSRSGGMADAADSKTPLPTQAGNSDRDSAGFLSDSEVLAPSPDDSLTIGDPIDAALVAALTVATQALDLDAIKLLTTELRERRLAAAGVVDLAARRGAR